MTQPSDSTRYAAPTVLMVSLAWPPEPFLLQTVRALQNAGVRLQVCVSARPGEKVDRLGSKTVMLPWWSVGWMRRLVTLAMLLVWHLVRSPRDTARVVRVALASVGQSTSLVASLQALYRLLPFAGLRPDVVHFQWNSSAIAYESLLDILRCKTVISCRGSQVNIAPFDPRRQSITADLQRTLGRATVVHCVSEAMAHEVRSLGIDPTKIRVIHPAVDTNFFRPGNQGPDRDPRRLRIVMTGSLVWVKGHEYALMGLRRLLDGGTPATLRIIGEGPSRQHVMFTVSDLGLDEAVTLVGRQSRERVLAELQMSDVFLLSSTSEGISNAALEAMACGLPVVTTSCGGMREAVAHGETGLVVPIRDPMALCEALRRLSDDGGLRRRMGTAARLRAVNDFDIHTQGEQFRRVYDEIRRPTE